MTLDFCKFKRTVNSGKSLWKTKGHAKSALKGHFDFRSVFWQDLRAKYLKNMYHGNEVLWKKWLDFAQAEGILEFVELK